jgi:uncharacterized membrane protein HdeD (DUF308 family)
MILVLGLFSKFHTSMILVLGLFSNFHTSLVQRLWSILAQDILSVRVYIIAGFNPCTISGWQN